MDIGESLVGAYLRQVANCHTIAFNQFLPGKQGEIDVIGIAGNTEQRHVWLIEVAVHLEGLNYGSTEKTITKIVTKLETARDYAATTYRDHQATTEFWSPCVPPGLAGRLADHGIGLVINEEFTRRVNVLASLASRTTKQYGDDSFRFLQLLTHLRGDGPTFAVPSQP